MRAHFILLLFLTPALGHAQQSSVAAEALFSQGREAMARGELAVACGKFAESQRLDPSVGTLSNLATCEEKSGRTATAWSHFKEVRDTAPSGDPRRAIAEERIAALTALLPRVVLASPRQAPAGTLRVTLDGVVMGPASLGAPLPVDPGQHVVTVESEGRRPNRVEVTVWNGETRTIDLVAGPVASEERAAARPAGEARTDRKLAGWVAGGAGVASIGASLILGGMAVSRRATVREHCPAQRCDEAGLTAATEGRVLTQASTVTFLAGAALTGLGAYFLLWTPSDASRVGASADASGGHVMYGRTF